MPREADKLDPVHLDPPTTAAGTSTGAIGAETQLAVDDGGLTRRTFVAAGYAAAARVGAQAIQFGVTVALARMLSPRDFGLVAIVAVFTGFAGQFSDLGIGAALIRQRPLTEEHLTSAFWLNALSGLVVALALFSLSPLVADIYGEPQLRSLMAVMALAPALSIAVVQQAILERNLRFHQVALVEISSTLLGGGVAIYLAASVDAGAFSIVAMTITTTAASSALYWVVVRWRPQFIWSQAATRDIWRFGSGIAGFAIVNYWARNADNLIVGKVSGAKPLGLYSRAYGLMLMPLNQLTWVAGRVMYPALSEVANSPERARRAYLRAVRAVAVVGIPVFAAMAVAARPLVLSIFGSNWGGMASIVRILALTGVVQVVASSVGWIYQSQGRADLLFKWGLLATPVLILSFVVGAHWGVRGVAIAYTAVNYLLLYPSIRLSGRLISLSFSQMFSSLRMILAAALVMAGSIWAVSILSLGGPYADLAAQVGTGAVVYLVALTALDPGTIREVRSMVFSHSSPRQYEART